MNGYFYLLQNLAQFNTKNKLYSHFQVLNLKTNLNNKEKNQPKYTGFQDDISNKATDSLNVHKY